MKVLYNVARVFTLALIVFVACASLAQAQSQFSYPNFASTSGLQLNGNAAVAINGNTPVLRLTPGTSNQNGTAWYTTEIPLSQGFTSTFTFQFTGQGGSGGHADGIAFMVQGAPAGIYADGDLGGAIGYGDDDGNSTPSLGIPNSVAVELDTYQNGWDPNNNHIAVMSCGTANNSQHHGLKGCASGADPTIGINSTFTTSLTDGNPHTVIVTYAPPCEGCLNLTVQLDGTQILAVVFDLATLGLGTNDPAYVGFTASTGGGFENQDITSWSFSAQTIVVPVSTEGPTNFTFTTDLSHLVDFSGASNSGNLTYPNNDPTTIQIQSTNNNIDPATWPQYVTGGPLATSILFPLISDNTSPSGTNGSLFVDLCFDPTLSGSAAIPSDLNCPYATSSEGPLLGIQISGELSSRPVINNPTNVGLTTVLAHYEPNTIPSITTWAPSPINGTPNPVCTNTTGTSTVSTPQTCDVLDIQQSIYGDPTQSGKAKSKGAFAMIYNVPMPVTYVSVNGKLVNAPPANNNSFSAGLWFNTKPLNLTFVADPACPLNPPTWPCTLPVPDTTYNYFSPAPIAGESFAITDLLGNPVYPVPPAQSPAQATPPTGFNTETVSQITFPGTSNQVTLPDGKYLLQWSAVDNVGISEQNVQLITTGTCPNPAGGTFTAPCYQTTSFQTEVNVDTTDPQITGPTLNPAPATYNGVANAYFLKQSAIGTFTCFDPPNPVASGIASCLGPTGPSGGSVPTTVVGKNKFTVNAADVAGNTATSSVPYVVVDQPVVLFPFYLAPSKVKPGTQVAYLVNLLNAGFPYTAYGVTFTINVTLPTGASIVSTSAADATCSVAGSVVTCNTSQLHPLAVAAVLITVSVPKTTTSGLIGNQVNATSLNRILGSSSTSFSIKVSN